MKTWILALDRLFLWVRSVPLFYRFTLLTRILMAAAFVPTGWVKLMGRRFTSLPTETPIGAFFEAMFQTGEYWQFIGGCQVAAGLLLLLPATAHLGALLFLPIITNIFVITVALGFKGTPVITGPMLLAVIYLCAWDYDRLRGILTPEPAAPPLRPAVHRLDRVECAGFTVFAVALVSCFLATRGGVPISWTPYLATTGLLAGLTALGRFLVAGRRRTASAEPA